MDQRKGPVTIDESIDASNTTVLDVPQIAVIFCSFNKLLIFGCMNI